LSAGSTQQKRFGEVGFGKLDRRSTGSRVDDIARLVEGTAQLTGPQGHVAARVSALLRIRRVAVVLMVTMAS